MQHDWNKYFDTNTIYWQKIQKIYDENDDFPKVIVSGRNLHHKFMRSFSRLEGTKVDNDKENLVSLSLPDHLRVHFYLWKCTKTGFKNRTSPPVRFMLKKALGKITEETIESIISDWDEDVMHQKNPKLAEYNHTRKGKRQTEEHKLKVREARKKYDVDLVNVVTLENVTQRGRRKPVFDAFCEFSNSNTNWNNYWIRPSEIELLNRTFGVDFKRMEQHERFELIKTFAFIKNHWKSDPEILDRIEAELKAWHE